MTGTLGTVVPAGCLIALAAVDGMFAGFRSSCGRTGLIRHGRADAVALVRGLLLGLLALVPVALLVIAIGTDPARTSLNRAGARAMLDVYLPYAAAVGLGLLCYGTLTWRIRFVASALLLGPLTLARPFVAALGAAAAVWATHDLLILLVAATAVGGILGIEPIAGHLWYTRADFGPDHRDNSG